MRMRVPDKKTVMCGFLIRPFYFAGRERNGLINRENPTNLLQVSVRRLWQRHDHIGLLYRGHGDGGEMCIRDRAMAYGRMPEEDSRVLLYSFAEERRGYKIIEYEIYRYQVCLLYTSRCV